MQMGGPKMVLHIFSVHLAQMISRPHSDVVMTTGLPGRVR